MLTAVLFGSFPGNATTMPPSFQFQLLIGLTVARPIKWVKDPQSGILLFRLSSRADSSTRRIGVIRHCSVHFTDAAAARPTHQSVSNRRAFDHQDCVFELKHDGFRAVAYNNRDAIRASNAWYQAFSTDILDDSTYSTLKMPVLGIGGPGFEWLKGTLLNKTANLKMVHLEKCGHFIAEEQPDETIRLLVDFLT